jgi:hypothetical protein
MVMKLIHPTMISAPAMTDEMTTPTGWISWDLNRTK